MESGQREPEHVIYEKRSHNAVVTLHRPEANNSTNPGFLIVAGNDDPVPNGLTDPPFTTGVPCVANAGD